MDDTKVLPGDETASTTVLESSMAATSLEEPRDHAQDAAGTGTGDNKPADATLTATETTLEPAIAATPTNTNALAATSLEEPRNHAQGVAGTSPSDTKSADNTPTAINPTLEPATAVTPVDIDVLQEFDPLAHDAAPKVEAEPVKETEEHRSDHPETSPTAPAPPPKDIIVPLQAPQTPLTSIFPQSTLSAIARTFSIPIKSRPTSMDIARPVPSPSKLSSFVARQQDPESRDPPQSATPPPPPKTEITADDSNTEPPAFDFQRFLDQMKHRSAEPVAKFLRSFLSNFAKRTFTVNDQVKIINDFLNFISARMREADVWKNVSDLEFDNAMEGMEKLVMNRLYEFTFTPQVAKMIPPRPVTADDLERDRVLSQRVALFGWLEEKHLDIPEGEGSKGFLMFAQQELLKINHYKAPRDKLICILNSCKVIFGLIRHLHHEEGADSFVPILIFVVLKANPEHLLSNVEYINRFRSQTKLQSEAGYYLSSLMGAVSFIETMDHTSLSNINQEEFEKNVEDAIQSLPFEPDAAPAVTALPKRTSSLGATSHIPRHAGEEAAQPLSMGPPGPSLGEDARRLLQKTGDTISKPLSAISRIFNEALDEAEDRLASIPAFQINRPDSSRAGTPPQTPVGPGAGGHQVGTYAPPMQTPYKPRVRRIPSSGSASGASTPPRGYDDTPSRGQPMPSSLHPDQHLSRTPTPALDIPALQHEIDQAHEQSSNAARETLFQIFPGVDVEVVDMVLEANEGDLGRSIEGLLEMSNGS